MAIWICWTPIFLRVCNINELAVDTKTENSSPRNRSVTLCSLSLPTVQYIISGKARGLYFRCERFTCASMTKISAPQAPNIMSESNAGSKKSICPGKSHIWNWTKELFDMSEGKQNKNHFHYSDFSQTIYDIILAMCGWLDCVFVCMAGVRVRGGDGGGGLWA